eukprot:712797_1
MSDVPEAVASIFEEESTITKETLKSTNESQSDEKDEKEEEKKDELIESFDYPPNSLNDAKSKYMKNKHRDSHKYSGGNTSPRTQVKQITNKVTQLVSDQIQETTDKLLEAADDGVKSLSASTGIQFAPISTPLKRRRQTFAVLVWSLLYFIALLLNFIAFRYWTGWKFY